MEDYKDIKKINKIINDPTKHYPNKDEARELRRIKASTGLTEEEIRNIKEYRKQLSDAQKAGEKSLQNRTVKEIKLLIKDACKITKLTPQHPETIKVLDELLQRKTYCLHIFHLRKYKAEQIVKLYCK